MYLVGQSLNHDNLQGEIIISPDAFTIHHQANPYISLEVPSPWSITATLGSPLFYLYLLYHVILIGRLICLICMCIICLIGRFLLLIDVKSFSLPLSQVHSPQSVTSSFRVSIFFSLCLLYPVILVCSGTQMDIHTCASDLSHRTIFAARRGKMFLSTSLRSTSSKSECFRGPFSPASYC